MLTAETTPEKAVSTKPNLGFLGVGWIGENRLKAIHQCGNSTVAAICDAAPETAKIVASEIDNCTILPSYQELIDTDLDGVVIATPSGRHADQVQAALEQNMAVFVQKPLALNTADTQKLVKLAHKNDCLLKVDFSYRCTKAMKAVKKVLDSGEIGKVFAADLVFHNAYGPDKEWYYDLSKSGGGCLTDLGIHLVDLLYWIDPEAEVDTYSSSLYKDGTPLRPGQKEVEDFATAQLSLNSGVTANIACSWNLNAGREAVIESTFYGTKGGVKFRNINGSFYDFEAVLFKGTQSTIIENSEDDWGGRAGVEWAAQLTKGNRFDPTNYQYIKVAETLDLIYGNA